MQSNQTQNQVIKLLNKNITIQSKSITETLCPKYRKFTNFPKVFQQQSRERSLSDTVQLQFVKKSSVQLNNRDKIIQGVRRLVTESNPNESHSQQSLSKKVIVIPQPYSNKSSSLANQVQSPLLKQRNHQQKQSTSQYQPYPSLSPSFHQQRARQHITQTFTQLNTMISSISQQFQKRMKTHQDQLLKIMFLQIKRLNLQCEKTINKYNQLIKIKASNQSNEQLLMQLGLYKKYSINKQQQNSQLKRQIQYIKRLNNQYQMRIKTDQQALRQITKKLLYYKKKCKHYQYVQMMDESMLLKAKHNSGPQCNRLRKYQQQQKQGLPQIITANNNKNNKQSFQQQQSPSSSSSTSVLQRSKPAPLSSSFTKPNSKSIGYSRRSQAAYSLLQRSLNKSPTNYQMSQIVQSQSSLLKDVDNINSNNNNINSLESTLLIKLDKQINSKYKSSCQRIEQLKLLSQTKAQKEDISLLSTIQKDSIKQQQQSQQQSQQPQQTRQSSQPLIIAANRQKVLTFLNKQSQQSIKSIVSNKKSPQKKKNNKRQFYHQKRRKSFNNDDDIYPESKIKVIKNRVRLSSFEQKEFLAMKRSLELSLLEKYNNGNNSSSINSSSNSNNYF